MKRIFWYLLLLSAWGPAGCPEAHAWGYTAEEDLRTENAEVTKRVEALIKDWDEMQRMMLNYQEEALRFLHQRDRYKEALEKIATHELTSIDKVYLLAQCEGYRAAARAALHPEAPAGDGREG